jgi:predicted GNAT family N-acyltransferase
MHARKSAVGFYEKFGYRISGNEFIEVSIPHIVMEKKLDQY